MRLGSAYWRDLELSETPLVFAHASVVALLAAQMVKNLPAVQETQVQPPDPWVGKMPWRRKQLPNSSILAWKIPKTYRPRLRRWRRGSCPLTGWGEVSVTRRSVLVQHVGISECLKRQYRGKGCNKAVLLENSFIGEVHLTDDSWNGKL